MLPITRLALLGFALICADATIHPAQASGQSPPNSRPLALQGGTIIDLRQRGQSLHDQDNMTVLIEHGLITHVGPADAVSIPDRFERIDASGRYLVPGLTDMFAGLNNQAQADAYLALGVTTIVVSDGDDRRGPLFRDATPGPRIRMMSIGDGLKWPDPLPDSVTSYLEALQYTRPLTRPEVIDEIERAHQSGISVLLLHYGVSDRQLKWYLKAARKHHIATIGELGAAHYRTAIRAGIDAFVHTGRYSLDLAPEPLRGRVAKDPFGPPRRQFYQYLVDLDLTSRDFQRHANRLGSGDAALIPTLSLFQFDMPNARNPWLAPAAAWLDAKDIHLPLDRQTGKPANTGDPISDAIPKAMPTRLLELEQQYCHHGALYLAGSGTDAFGTMPGISLHRELELLTQACLTPRQAIAAATSNIGEALPWREPGLIQVGARADILLLRNDPTEDLQHLQEIETLVLDGRLIKTRLMH